MFDVITAYLMSQHLDRRHHRRCAEQEEMPCRGVVWNWRLLRQPRPEGK